jgi:hypothetical protein
MTDLDMSWIKEYSRMHSIQQIVNKEEMDDIGLQIIYMDVNREIKIINKHTITLSTITLSNNDRGRGISKEQLLKIIQDTKTNQNRKYKLFDILLYKIDLEPKDIQRYVNGECNATSVLKSIPIVDDINIEPSLFIFHSLYTIFLFFEELNIINPCIVKSIMKTGENAHKPKHTKKVRINDICDEIILSKCKSKKTRKIWTMNTAMNV